MHGVGVDGEGGAGEAGVQVVGQEDDGHFGMAVAFPGGDTGRCQRESCDGG